MPPVIEYIGICSVGLDIVAIDIDDWLDSGELAASVSVAAVSGVTIANKAVTGEKVINGETVVTGRNVSFSITGQTTTGGNGTGLYSFDVTITTDSTPARVQTRTARVQVQ